MKAFGEFELESIEVKLFYGDPCIYFNGEGQSKLALPFSSAKKAVVSAKKLSSLLKVKYNIRMEVKADLLNESENVNEEKEEDQENKKETTMANVKRSVNVKALCRECFEQKMEKKEILSKIAAVYIEEGKDEKYAQSRAKSVYSSIRKERGLAPERKGRKKEEVIETTETPADAENGVEAPQPQEPENTEVQEETEPQIEEVATEAEEEEAEESEETEVEE